MKSLILAAMLLAHGDGRWCSDYYCTMCNRNHLIQGHNIDTSGMGPNQLITLHNDLHAIKIDSTPMNVVRRMIEIAQPTPDDIFYDIGCGDGRILIEAYKFTKKVHGIEIKPEVAELAKRKLRQAGISSKRIITGDATKYKLDAGTIVTMYLFPDTIDKILPKLGAAKILSYNHRIPGYTNKEYKIGTGTIYFVDLTWRKYLGVYK